MDALPSRSLITGASGTCFRCIPTLCSRRSDGCWKSCFACQRRPFVRPHHCPGTSSARVSNSYLKCALHSPNEFCSNFAGIFFKGDELLRSRDLAYYGIACDHAELHVDIVRSTDKRTIHCWWFSILFSPPAFTQSHVRRLIHVLQHLSTHLPTRCATHRVGRCSAMSRLC